jgi:hypothetical protein
MQWADRIAHYDRTSGFPRSLFIASNYVVGTWVTGNSYGSRTGYYGEYPNTYLRRIAALFPDRRAALHVFSGKVDLAAFPGDTKFTQSRRRIEDCQGAVLNGR